MSKMFPRTPQGKRECGPSLERFVVVPQFEFLLTAACGNSFSRRHSNKWLKTEAIHESRHSDTLHAMIRVRMSVLSNLPASRVFCSTIILIRTRKDPSQYAASGFWLHRKSALLLLACKSALHAEPSDVMPD